MALRPLTPLCELAKKYQTDKGGRHFTYGGKGQSAEICHEYTPLYYDVLKDKVDSMREVLEIGVNAGCSLRMWEEFFPNANIYGLDIEHGYLFSVGRIKCFWADATDGPSLVRPFPEDKKFDLIIDDGSHELGHQVNAWHTLLPRLTPNGLYIVEDVYHPDALMKTIPSGFAALQITIERDHLVFAARNE